MQPQSASSPYGTGTSALTVGLALTIDGVGGPSSPSGLPAINHAGHNVVAGSNYSHGGGTGSGILSGSPPGAGISPSAEADGRPGAAVPPGNQSTTATGKRKVGRSATDDVQQYMNIHHFEQLMAIFKSHRNEDGEEGFDIDTFREVFGKVLGGNLSFDQMTQLFMKIDANSDGTVSWDEFSTFVVMVGGLNQDYTKAIVDEKIRKLVDSSHKDLIKRIDYITKERKYMSISREGSLCLWSPKLKLQRSLVTREGSQSWVTDAVLLQDQNKLAIVSDDRQLTIYEMMQSIKPRKLVTIAPLENNPLCIAYTSKFEEERSLLVFGDDGGYINILSFTRRFFADYVSDTEAAVIKPSALSHKEENPYKGTITLHRKKIHTGWVERIQLIREINAFVTCSSESAKSLVISDLERKTTRSISVPKGVRCFDACRRPSFLVTGGRDKIVRLWNPYVLSKAAGSLVGHNATVTDVLVNQTDGHVISLSEDKVIKIWNIKTFFCLQTLTDRFPHRPENIISSIYFDNVHRQLITGSNKLEAWPLYTQLKQSMVETHEAPVVAALFNTSFHQVVSGGEDSTVSVWDAHTGEKTFQFNQVHGELEITAMCFDNSGRRLITASRDGVIKIWNFNNGQLLRKCFKNNTAEVSAVLFVEVQANKYVIAVGWDHKISVFLDSPEDFECWPLREISDAHRGHHEDILCVAMAPPSLLATGGLDGLIVAWNIESGTWRANMKDPFLEYKSLECKAVEDIRFVYDRTQESYPRTQKFPLVSAHADGFVRIWDVYEGRMVHEVSADMIDNEGLTALAVNEKGTLLVVGGSQGHVRVFHVRPISLRAGETYDDKLVLGCMWKCHTMSITSVNFVTTHDMILTASVDTTVRSWCIDGMHIGIFGQEDTWDLEDPSTFAVFPADVRQDNIIEQRRDKILTTQRQSLKRAVIDLWTTSKPLSSPHYGVGHDDLDALEHAPFDMDDELAAAWANFKAFEASMDSKDPQVLKQLQELEVKVMQMVSDRMAARPDPAAAAAARDPAAMRTKTIQTNVVRKWREYTANRKLGRDWRIDDASLSVHSDIQHFCYSHARTRAQRATHAVPPPAVKIGAVRPETVYKELVKHTKYELEEIKLPEKPNSGGGGGSAGHHHHHHSWNGGHGHNHRGGPAGGGGGGVGAAAAGGVSSGGAAGLGPSMYGRAKAR
ncbi:WD repeat-containing protein 49 [Allomyces arbusculus]|nr:WD repeat-containing protein 49 [Allomyces arbusculus]